MRLAVTLDVVSSHCSTTNTGHGNMFCPVMPYPHPACSPRHKNDPAGLANSSTDMTW